MAHTCRQWDIGTNSSNVFTGTQDMHLQQVLLNVNMANIVCIADLTVIRHFGDAAIV